MTGLINRSRLAPVTIDLNQAASDMLTLLWPLLIYWLVFFVACFVVVEVAQDQLYDEVTPYAGLKVAGGSLLIAALLTWLRWSGSPATFDAMFTTSIVWTFLQGIVWFAVFALILQFHPWHALGLGLATMLLVTGLATMGVESLLAKAAPARPTAAASVINNQPVRQAITPGATATVPKAP